MATLLQTAGGGDSGGSSDTSIVVNGASFDPLATITAGSLVLLWVKWEGGATTATPPSGFTALTQTERFGDLCVQWFYRQAAAGGETSYTVSFAASRTWRRMAVLEYSYTGTVAFLNQVIGGGDFTNAMSSGSFTISGTDLIVAAGFGEYIGENITTERINAVAPDAIAETGTATFTVAWTRLLTTGFTGAATAQYDNGQLGGWIVDMVAFSVTSGGGGGAIPVIVHHLRQQGIL